MGGAGEDVGGMMQAIVTMLCGIGSLICVIWQQRIIQLQNEEIQQHKEILALRDEQLGAYESINLEQARQIGLLKEYAALLRQEAGHE